MGTCFIIGNGGNDKKLFQLIYTAAERHIREHGIREFVVCNQSDFDRVAAAAVIGIKKKYHSIILSQFFVIEPESVRPEISNTIFPDYERNIPKWFAVIKEKRNIVDNSVSMIVYNCGLAKKTLELMEYARKREAEGKLFIEEIFD